jgi:hypothetical protein
MDEVEKKEKEVVLDQIDNEEPSSVDKQLNDMSGEAKVYLGGHSTEEQFVPSKLNVKSPGNGAKIALVVLSLLLLGALAATGWLFMQRQATLSELESTKGQLAESRTTANRYKLAADSALQDKNTAAPQSELSTEEAAELATSQYYCRVKDFGCDKVAPVVMKIDTSSNSPNPQQRNRVALVKAVTGPESELTTKAYLWLVSDWDADTWTVVYMGNTNPSAETVEKFGIPKDYLL